MLPLLFFLSLSFYIQNKKMPRFNGWWGLLLLLMTARCTTDHQDPEALFQLLSADQTGIDFQNTVQPDEEYSLLDFEYLYNGGGVGIGDFNADGLPDVVFTGNRVKSRLYLNKGNLRFEDVTESSGLNTEGKWCAGISIVDINQDGHDDIYICVGGPGKKSMFPNLLYVNQGDLTFVESAAAYGLADPNESNQAAFFDYDRDGDLDMYLLNGGGFERSAVTIKPILTNGRGRNTDRLYENLGSDSLGHPIYRDASEQAGITIEGFGLGVGILDVNYDGWPDVYVSNDYLSRDLLYLNQQDGTFRESIQDFLTHMSHFSMGNDIGDLNNDGLFDIVTLDMLPEGHYRRKMMFGPNQEDRFYRAVDYGYGYQYMRNMLHLSVGENRFSEIGRLAGIEKTDWSWAPLIADFDNDGLQDLHITNGYGRDITDLDFVNFRENAQAPFASPEEYRKLMNSSVQEQPSIILPNYVYRNKGDQTFENIGEKWGIDQSSISNGAAYVDLDLDGDLEIITSNLNQPAFIYRNTLREKDSLHTHYLGVQLTGEDANSNGFGATVTVHAGGTEQVRYVQPVRGFQSTVTKVQHFGLGSEMQVDSLVVTWPDGRRSVQQGLQVDQVVTVNYDDSVERGEPGKGGEKLLEPWNLINFRYEESVAVSDYRTQPLLFHGFANQGPGMAVGDVNGDQLDDLVIGGQYGANARIFLQAANGNFSETELETRDFEDLGLLLFDLEGDGDLDLYATSGGTERYAGHQYYQDRVYVNDGSRNFEREAGVLPEMLTSTACVVGGDVDADGDLDLFVGGRVIPGQFPIAPNSYLLLNEGGKFIEATGRICPELAQIGMVTSAVWTDFDNDHHLDLIVVGEMMDISVFRSNGQVLQNVTQTAGLDHSAGMWNSIISADFDRDGDMDYAVGNVGQNTSFEASTDHPLMLHYADYDANGSVDPIYSVYEEGAYYPFAARDVLVRQLPELKKKLLHYSSYASSTTDDILSYLDADNSQTMTCEFQSSIILENLGEGRFEIRYLPGMAQVSTVKGMMAEDVNQDGLTDLILVGNDYTTEVVSGIYSASVGQVLINRGNWKFEEIDPSVSGLRTSGDTRALTRIRVGGDQMAMLTSTNDGPLQGYQLPGVFADQLIPLQADESSAILERRDGSRTMMEFPWGSGYLSQSTRTLRIPPQTHRVVLYDVSGNQTREISQ